MENVDKKLAITPETRVGELLENYPKLEETLISMSPTFSKLKNPVLRKTIAKVATLQQVAKIGEVSIGEMINTLRKAAGHDCSESYSESEDKTANSMPDWMRDPHIAKSLNAIPIIEAGEHPMGVVLGDLKKLAAGEVYELITPFLPVPLIDMIRSKGYECWSTPPLAGQYRNYFTPGRREAQ